VSDIIDFSEYVANGRNKRGQQGGTKQAVSTAGTPAPITLSDGERPDIVAGTPVHYIYPGTDTTEELELVTTADNHARLTIRAPKQAVAKAVEEARSTIARSAGVDERDIRMMDQLKSQLGEDNYSILITSIAQHALYSQALERTGVLPFLPEKYLTDDPVDPQSSYVCEVEMLLHPKVELSSYDPVEVEFPEKAKVTSADVTEFLDGLSRQFSTFEPDLSRDITQDGDIVLISVSTKSDLPGYRPVRDATKQYQIGSAAMGEEFDRGITGMKVGETRDISLSLPSGVTEDGQASYSLFNITVRLLEIDRAVPARIDDAWVMSNYPQAKTLLGFRQEVRRLLEKQADEEFNEKMMGLTAHEFSKRLVWDIPQEYADAARDEFMSSFSQELALHGLTIEDYAASPDFDEKQFAQEVERDSIDHLREALALDALADHRNIEVSDKNAAEQLLQGSLPAEGLQGGAQGSTPSESNDALHEISRELEGGNSAAIRQLARRRLANEWLVKTAKDSSGPHLQLV
jgi:FKBP-type peptidyl-prolyl cis-trans isomerase (trigger factor)